MKAISAFDLQIIPELSHLSMFDMIDLNNDKLIYPYLAEMGFDTDYPIHYTVSQHRTLQNTVKIGYVLRGEVSINRKDLNGPWATITDKLVAAEYMDISLCREMMEQMSTSLNYDSFHTATDVEANEPFPSVLADPDESRITAELNLLKDILLLARGNPYAKDGNLKMPKDYEPGADVEVNVQRKKRRKKISNEKTAY